MLPAGAALQHVRSNLGLSDTEINSCTGNKGVTHIRNTSQGGAQPALSSVAKNGLILPICKEAAGNVLFHETFSEQTFPYLEKLVLQEAPPFPPRESPESEECILLHRFWLHRHRR